MPVYGSQTHEYDSNMYDRRSTQMQLLNNTVNMENEADIISSTPDIFPLQGSR